MTPQDPAEFPGDPTSIATTHALGGQQTSSVRSQSGSTAAGTALTYDQASFTSSEDRRSPNVNGR